MLDKLRNFHFIGIGGAGMSAIAYVLIKRGYNVSGSDLNAGRVSARLANEGAMVFMGHDACQVSDADAEAVVVSTAIHADNPELVAAKEQGIPVYHRSDLLAAIFNKGDGVAVAGAHGKTTTSAMLSCIAVEGKVDPTVIIGGEVSSLGGNACNGAGSYIVAEADESDGSFLKLNPSLVIVTNIEDDHLDYYGTEENIYAAFKQFLSNITPGGKAILCVDNAKVKALAQETEQEVITYGLEEADYVAKDICYGVDGTTYKLYYKDEFITEVRLIVPGRHNVLNSVGAFAAAREMGIATESVLASLAKFGGAKRRFETKGKVGGVWIVDDYAHHPTEIEVTLKAARQTQPKRLLCLFQPHRYSRTKLLFNEFCNCFADCDELILTDIYAASEAPIPGITSEALAEGVRKALGKEVTYIPRLAKAEEYLEAKAAAGDLILTVGAGDVFKVGEELVRELERKNK
ncbi:MAG: UDP-N-acetylmuramate--L-alanine ligase [Acidaminococcaceae bacterium]|nr:UDP-N-acetylmuramate--L-alanine ligase [Acidaminococcaceae bacterium]